MEKLLLRPAEAGEVLGLGRSKIYELLANGSIPSIRIGKSVRVPVERLREWLNNQPLNSDGEKLEESADLRKGK